MKWDRSASFYEQVAAILEAGMPIAQAVQLAGDAAGGDWAAGAARWSAGCLAGRALSEQLGAERCPAFDVAMLKAGEASGNLPAHCRELTAHYRHLASLRRLVLKQLSYPAMIVQVGLLCLGVLVTFTRGSSPAVIVGLPLAFWAALGAAWMSAGLVSASLRARLALLGPVAKLTVPMVAANACTVLRAAIAAGLAMPESIELAARACGNEVLGERLARAGMQLRQNRLTSLSAALGRGGLPALVVDHARIGEGSGTLETTLGQAAALMRDSFRVRSEWTARALAGFAYAAVLLCAAAIVVVFWSGYHAAAMTVPSE